jgi:hypothetical protein
MGDTIDVWSERWTGASAFVFDPRADVDRGSMIQATLYDISIANLWRNLRYSQPNSVGGAIPGAPAQSMRVLLALAMPENNAAS